MKLRGAPGTAQVFLDGAYEGIAGNLQTMSLAPGAHDLLISAPDRETFHRRIYVLSGKELKVTAVLKPKQ